MLSVESLNFIINHQGKKCILHELELVFKANLKINDEFMDFQNK